MKKLVVAGLAVVLTLGMAGCGKDITLTTEQNDLIAEYVAGTMLKYSYDNEWKYTKLSIAQNTYVPQGSSTQSTTAATTTTGNTNTQSTKTNAGGSATSASTNPMTALPTSLGLSNVSISVSGVSIGTSYPTGALAIAVPALSGCQVAAVEFHITNTSTGSVTLNTTSSTVNMKLTVSGNNVIQTTSILKNDINGLKNITLGAGESYTAVAIFQVEESIASQVSGSTLTINSGSTSLGSVTVK